MTRLEALREAYAADDIDLPTFERFVGAVVNGEDVVLPDVVNDRLRHPGDMSALSAILKEAWTEDSLRLAQKRRDLATLRVLGAMSP